jgi:hypothetical protein
MEVSTIETIMSEKNFDMDLLGRGAFGEVGQFVRAEDKSFAVKKIK